MSVVDAVLPACTVRFDPTMGCGIKVGWREVSGTMLVSIAIVTRRGTEPEHWFSFGQVEQLRAALDAIIGQPSVETEGSGDWWRNGSGEAADGFEAGGQRVPAEAGV